MDKRAIIFTKEGARPFSTNKPKPNLLQSARSWEMRVDVERRLQFPELVHCGQLKTGK